METAVFYGCKLPLLAWIGEYVNVYSFFVTLLLRR